MIDKDLITNKLENFFKEARPENFLKVFIISFIFEKMNYLEKIIGHEDTIKILDKYIYNLSQNVKKIEKLEKYHSIYTKYNFREKSLKYYMTNNYNKLKSITLSPENKKKVIIKEFQIMMYKEFETIININTLNEKIVSNGFYIEDKYGRYPEYEADFSNIMDIFYELDACNITNTNYKVKVYIDESKEYFVYSKHISKRNSEVINYVELLRKFIDDKIFYLAINNPQVYSEKMIKDFNQKYDYIFDYKYDFLLNNKDVFSLIENYLLHIRNRINIENNVKYHQDLSTIFKMMNYAKNITNFSEYVLHSSNQQNELEFEKI